MKRLVSIVLAIAMVAGGWACKKDKTKDDMADKIVVALKAAVLDENGNVNFDETEVSGLYEIGVESKEDATLLAGIYAGSGFKGENYTRTIPDGKGTVKVTKGSNGVFYSVHFAVEGIPNFTLDIVNGDGENKESTYHKCKVCKRQWKGTSTDCPWASLHDQQEQQ